MWCQFLQHSKVNQLYVYKYPVFLRKYFFIFGCSGSLLLSEGSL